MKAKELKRYLSEDTDRIIKTLEHFEFHDFWTRNDEIRCATPTGENNSSVSVKVDENLFSSNYSDVKPFHGDLIGMLESVSGKDFKEVMKEIHILFTLPMGGKTNKKKDIFEKARKLAGKRRKTHAQKENKEFDKDILDKYLFVNHPSMIEEAIDPKVLRMFDVRYDINNERIVMPHFDWVKHDSVVGIKSRITLDTKTAETLGISKYTNLITGYRKTNNLYGWHLANQHVKDNKMLIIFESEKSVMKQFTIEKGKGFSVSVGGHDKLSIEQKRFIVNNTTSDTEIVFAFDKDVTTQAREGESKKGEPTDYIEEVCSDISKFRKVSFIYDRYGLLSDKDAPIDKGLKIWKFLLSDRKEVGSQSE